MRGNDIIIKITLSSLYAIRKSSLADSVSVTGLRKRSCLASRVGSPQVGTAAEGTQKGAGTSVSDRS